MAFSISGAAMTLEQMRQQVLDNRSTTLMANAFRNAFGISPRHDERATTISRNEWKKRKQRREVMQAMAQRYGALDRG